MCVAEYGISGFTTGTVLSSLSAAAMVPARGPSTSGGGGGGTSGLPGPASAFTGGFGIAPTGTPATAAAGTCDAALAERGNRVTGVEDVACVAGLVPTAGAPAAATAVAGIGPSGISSTSHGSSGTCSIHSSSRLSRRSETQYWHISRRPCMESCIRTGMSLRVCLQSAPWRWSLWTTRWSM